MLPPSDCTPVISVVTEVATYAGDAVVLPCFDEWLQQPAQSTEFEARKFNACVQEARGELRDCALMVLNATDAAHKVDLMRALFRWSRSTHTQPNGAWLDAQRDWCAHERLVLSPARPARPELVAMVRTPRQSMHTQAGRAMALHALAHIEFNAIHLALDAVVRFDGLSDDYYWDWWRVAAEEAYHFWLITQHMQSLGVAYGDYPAHDGLWMMAQKTQHSFVDRMAMVPRTLEARGLDACPVVQDKFRQVKDWHAVAILDVILRDEIQHVALGNRWFVHACAQRSMEPIYAYKQLSEQYQAPRIRPPLNTAARRAAGFFEVELDAWLYEGQTNAAD